MPRLTFPLVGLAVCYALLAAVLIESSRLLPARIASHFDQAGRPNAWMSNSSEIAVMVAAAILLPALIVGLSVRAGRLPRRLVNLPHRDYWLAPERRATTTRELVRFTVWFASLTVLFFAGVQGLILQANRMDGAPQLNNGAIGAVAGGFVLATFLWCGLLLFHFSRVPENAPPR